jgi:hypothetical protein
MSGFVLDQAHGAGWSLYHADCVPGMAALPADSVDFSVYSPPFSSLYIYSESVADMGNVASDEEFAEQYRHAVREKFRVTRPGRLTAIHVKDLVYYQNSSPRGTAGLRPFSDLCTKIHVEEGWDFHCRVTIARDPVREMQKTKAHGLLWRTIKEDSSFSRTGLPEYLMVYRKWATTEEERAKAVRIGHTAEGFPVAEWQRLASPVWPTNGAISPVWNYPSEDLPETDVLNVKVARSDRDEKHLCPMPLNITRRAMRVWSRPGDVVLSPFGGIGSEGTVALANGCRFVGFELKPEYFRLAARHLADAEAAAAAGTLLDRLDQVAAE